ncbi:MAG: ATP-dependent DNA ligase, partial [Burkholderiaceae bacterium]
MREFARLFLELDASTSTRAKVAALTRYLTTADDLDAAWAVYFLAGGKPRQAVPSKVLREFAVTASGLPEWLFEESYHAVGDLAETVSLLLPPAVRRSEKSLAEWVVERVLPLRGQPADAIKSALVSYFDELDTGERFLLVKLIGGAFRVGVSRLLVTRALAEHAGVDARQMAQRMIGYTDDVQRPTAERYRALIGASTTASAADPYPFFLAAGLTLPLDRFEDELGSPAGWLVEWKYDGIRAQLVRRSGETWLWSRGEELISERFPDVLAGLQ